MPAYGISWLRRPNTLKLKSVQRQQRRPYAQGRADFTQLHPDDPRPPWFYSVSLLLRGTLIPIAAVYGVFFYDFGEQEHVFMPPRRWLERQKQAFFSLSPAERELVERTRREQELKAAEKSEGV